MIQFHCDYTEGAHPKILEKLYQTNMEQLPGYGKDHYCASAIKKIRTACGKSDIDVHFISGGTQTNLIAAACILKPYEAVISVNEGHIACHEVGAIEATGHKVIPFVSKDGTISAQQIYDFCSEYLSSPDFEFMVKPGMIYISYATESGTLYSKQDLLEIKEVCNKFDIPLYIDGARMGYALMSPDCDVTLQEITEIADMFYIGGTKCGAIIGEALVITNDKYKPYFRHLMKQRGGMLAKGRLLGIQFDVLFSDNLYFDICKSAVDQALKIREAFEKKGITMWGNSFTNQQFPILTDKQLSHFDEHFTYEPWGKTEDGMNIVRFCTCWATKDENVDLLINHIEKL